MEEFGQRVWEFVQWRNGEEIATTLEDFIKRRITGDESQARLNRILSVAEETLRKADADNIEDQRLSATEVESVECAKG